MEKLTPFVFEEKNVRTLTKEDGSIWFVAKDVADVLEYKKYDSNLIGHIPDEWKDTNPVRTPGGYQEMTIISESGLYFFLARSDKPKALLFQKWIAGEVIPSICRTGNYSAKKADKFTLMRHMVDVLEAQAEEIQRHKSELKGLQMDLYKRGGYFCVAGYLKRLGQKCDTKTAAKYGRKM